MTDRRTVWFLIFMASFLGFLAGWRVAPCRAEGTEKHEALAHLAVAAIALDGCANYRDTGAAVRQARAAGIELADVQPGGVYVNRLIAMGYQAQASFHQNPDKFCQGVVALEAKQGN